MHAPVLIHIGYAKAASTWLQAHLLDNADLGFRLPFARSDVKRLLVQPSPFQFDADLCRRFFYPTLKSIRDAFPVISSENLTGTSRIGDHQRKNTADRLAAVFPNARILLVLREQNSMLLTQYHQYLRRGGVWGLRKFLRPPLSDLEQTPYFDWQRFQYHHLIKYYHQLFGRDNVLVLPLELLSLPCDFAKRITNFCQVEVSDSATAVLPVSERRHASDSAMLMSLGRPLNYLIHQPTSFNPNPLVPAPVTVKRYSALRRMLDGILPNGMKARFEDRAKNVVAEEVRDYFSESNLKTSELIGTDLSEFGYLMRAA